MDKCRYYKNIDNDHNNPVFYKRREANFRTSSTVYILREGEWHRSAWMDYEFENFLEHHPSTVFELTPEEVESVLVMIELVAKPKEGNYYELSMIDKIQEDIAYAVKIPIRYLFGEGNDKT